MISPESAEWIEQSLACGPAWTRAMLAKAAQAVEPKPFDPNTFDWANWSRMRLRAGLDLDAGTDYQHSTSTTIPEHYKKAFEGD